MIDERLLCHFPLGGYDPHIHQFGLFGDFTADGAQTEYGKCFSVDFLQFLNRRPLPQVLLLLLVQQVEPAGETEHHPQNVFGHRDAVDALGVAD